MRHLALCILAIVACKRDKLREPIGARIEPPGGLRLGMTATEAKASMPELGERFGGAGSAGGESPGAFLANDAQLIANMKHGRIAQLIVVFDGSQMPTEKIDKLLVD